MANRAPLGGSPLGLINLKSTPNGPMSTFNGGNSRNVNVNSYNNNTGTKHPGSLFTGVRILRPWPDAVAIKSKGKNPMGIKDVTYKSDGTSIDTSSRSALHNDSIYDTSVLNIIEKLSGTKAELRPADFAYLKDIGVFPNNRLMIARRFSNAIGDNIMFSKESNADLSAFAVLIGWLPENQDFLDISFGEKWVDAEADFKGVLTSLGEDVGLKNSGGIGGAFGNILPLPGFTEIFQRQFLAKIGVLEDNANETAETGDNANIPAGNPNLIKEAKRRSLVSYGEPGSGLTTTITIKMKCEYEMKFISGIDPTIVWMDLLGMIVRFGTSRSDPYGLSKGLSEKIIKWSTHPKTFLDDIILGLRDGIKGIIDDINSATGKTADFIKQAGKTASDKPDIKSLASSISGKLNDVLNDGINGLASKYKIKILGIINALSGLPSTPWHITIGNPLRPVFCSGDMLTTNVSLKLGPTLAFNDLPSNITVEFDLTNARPWGLQEIMAKFNSGYLRTVEVQKTYFESGDNGTPGATPGIPSAGTQSTPVIPVVLKTQPVGNGFYPGNIGTASAAAPTKVGNPKI